MGARSPPSHLFVCILCSLELWGQLGTAEVGNGLFVTLYHSLPKEELLVCFKSVLGEPVNGGREPTSIPSTSPLARILADGQNWRYDPVIKKKWFSTFNTTLPMYVFSWEECWSLYGSLNYSSILQLELFVQDPEVGGNSMRRSSCYSPN